RGRIVSWSEPDDLSCQRTRVAFPRDPLPSTQYSKVVVWSAALCMPTAYLAEGDESLGGVIHPPRPMERRPVHTPRLEEVMKSRYSLMIGSSARSLRSSTAVESACCSRQSTLYTHFTESIWSGVYPARRMPMRLMLATRF